jgi:ubiquitin conjugation factor E4 B
LGGQNSATTTTPSDSNGGTPRSSTPTQQTTDGADDKLSRERSTTQTPTEKKPVKINVSKPRPASPKRERPRTTERPAESIETWQDKMLRQVFRVTLKVEEVRDIHGNSLIFLPSTKEDLTEPLLNVDVLEGAITEAAGQAPGGNIFEYLLTCFKRVSRMIRGARTVTADELTKLDILKETRRLCMSYCLFAVTLPDMFGQDAAVTNPLVDHLLADPESDVGICTDFLTQVSAQLDENEDIKVAIVSAAEELSRRLSQLDMLADYTIYVRAMRNILRFPKIVDAVTQSPLWAPSDVEAQNIETSTILGPFFRLSPMQQQVANSYFSAPRSRDRGFIANAQNAVRMTLRTLQDELFTMADTVVRASPATRERILNWFALCVNKNHKKRAMRVDPRIVSGDGFMVNVTNTLDRLSEPFMDASFSKIEKVDVDYLRREPRVDISDETKINADQKASDEFYSNKADGKSNFISEVFFLTVAAHHYGTEAAQTRMTTMQKTVKRWEKDQEQFEAERHKYINVGAYIDIGGLVC